MFSIFYQYESFKRSILMPASVTPITVRKWQTLLAFIILVCLTLTACSHSSSDKDITHFDTSPPKDITETANSQSGRIDSDRINIVSPDWGNAATLTAMGHAPIATGDIRVWTRTDLGTRCFKTSNRTGPDWKDVRGRISVDANTGRILDIEDGPSITREREHRKIDRNRTFDVETYLIYQGRCWVGDCEGPRGHLQEFGGGGDRGVTQLPSDHYTVNRKT